MKLQNNRTGDTLEVPRPDRLGKSVVRFNGRVVEKVIYSDVGGGSVTTDDGRVFTVDAWSAYLIEKLRIRGWEVVN